jgi:hypothetical protein
MPSLTTLLLISLGAMAIAAWSFGFYHRMSRHGDYGKSCLAGCAFALLVGVIVLVGGITSA